MKNKMNHRQKQRLARKNMTRREIIARVGIFQTEFWEERKEKIRQKVWETENNRARSKDK
ncbi:MAG: hypothetical protein JETCAE03_32350 [Ignavibacteriaceae bacterium]|nr:MAG: hypothetical protein JETCAE03_32350 [Ignavibacteriaceae bacterium]